ncbi:uncharacterized protein LOC143869848 [Tasmannia lanceolata]|uniref:uncharacterized protein LOC143869848 n=1 Tax=Tasmannia lanceolata TaxID=3420 RepID=UPI0040641AC7
MEPTNLAHRYENQIPPQIRSPARNIQAEESLAIMDELQRQIRELQQQMKTPCDPDLLAEWDSEIASPFTLRVADAVVTTNSDMPRLDLYDGSSDPLEFPLIYSCAMVIRNASDATMCKASSAYLKKDASNWFSRLRPNSIESFHELGKEFVAYFINSRPRKKPADALLALRQEKDETLRRFIGRFRMELHQISEPNFDMVRAALRHAIRNRDMKVALNVNPPRDIQDLMATTDRLARLGKIDRYLQNPPRSHQRPRSEVHRRDECHRSPNHQAESSRHRAPDQEEAPKVIRNIDTIYRGPTSGGPTDEGCALYAGQANSIENPTKKPKTGPSTNTPITFTEADYGTIDRHHDDAVVVRLTIANCSMGRILVDTRSSVNVLHQNAFAEMGINKLEPVNWSIFRFSGGKVKVRGKTKLPVTFGTHPNQRTIMQTFVVVYVPSSCNGIIGRPALNELGAVVSTAHLKIKFPTKLGVEEVIGNQEKARECYAALLKKKKAAKETFSIGSTDPRVEVKQGEPVEKLTKIPLFHGTEDQTVQKVLSCQIQMYGPDIPKTSFVTDQ